MRRSQLATILTTALLTITVSACAGAVTSGQDGATTSTIPVETISPSATPETASPSATGLTPQGPVITGTVVRVVDGDTVRFIADGQREEIAVRLIGINTPETVAPGRPVECFGPEASQFAKDQLDGARVLLEFDPSQGETDRYDRTLAYVWTVAESGEPLELFNLESVRGGFAEERQYGKPFTWQSEFIEAQRQAQRDGAGMWGAC